MSLGLALALDVTGGSGGPPHDAGTIAGVLQPMVGAIAAVVGPPATIAGVLQPMIGDVEIVNVPPPPTIASTNKSITDTHGGCVVIATGTNLASASAVTYGGTSCTAVSAPDDAHVQFTTPAQSAGDHAIVVTAAGGTSNSLTGVLEAWYPTQAFIHVYDAKLNATVSAWNDQGSGAKNLTASANADSVSGGYVNFTPQEYYSIGSKETTGYGAGITQFLIGKWTSTVAAGFASTNAPLTAIGTNSVPYCNFGVGAVSGAGGGIYCLAGQNSAHHTANLGLNDGVPHLVGITWNGGTGDLIFYHGATQQGATQNEGYVAAFAGYQYVGAGDFPTVQDGWNGGLSMNLVTTGVVSGANLAKLAQFATDNRGAT